MKILFTSIDTIKSVHSARKCIPVDKWEIFKQLTYPHLIRGTLNDTIEKTES